MGKTRPAAKDSGGLRGQAERQTGAGVPSNVSPNALSPQHFEPWEYSPSAQNATKVVCAQSHGAKRREGRGGAGAPTSTWGAQVPRQAARVPSSRRCPLKKTARVLQPHASPLPWGPSLLHGWRRGPKARAAPVPGSHTALLNPPRTSAAASATLCTFLPPATFCSFHLGALPCTALPGNSYSPVRAGPNAASS